MERTGHQIVAHEFPYDSDDVRYWPKCLQLMPHATAVLELSEEMPVAPESVSLLLNQTGNYLWSRAAHSEAEPLYRRALEIDEAAYGKDHPDVATDLNNLAGLLEAQGKVTKAEPLSRRALEIDEAAYGKDHPDVATDLNNLALLLKTQGKVSEAEPLHRRALEIREAQLGPDHPNTVTARNNLNRLLEEMHSKEK